MVGWRRLRKVIEGTENQGHRLALIDYRGWSRISGLGQGWWQRAGWKGKISGYPPSVEFGITRKGEISDDRRERCIARVEWICVVAGSGIAPFHGGVDHTYLPWRAGFADAGPWGTPRLPRGQASLPRRPR
jgi:hypothetical protein